MKLWIDDIRNAPDESWTVARTVNSAIRALAMFTFDEISLDHDISHQIGMDEKSRPYPCNETFLAVAHYIAIKYVHLGITEYPTITIHSANPVGAAEMQAILSASNIHSSLKRMGAANRLELEV